MSKLGYIAKCIRKMSFKGLFDTVGEVHKRSGKNRVGLFFDIVWCGLRYGAGYKDYALNEWWNLNGKQRKTFITRGINNAVIKKCNDPAYYHILKDKTEFSEYFGEYIRRGQINLAKASLEDFERFMSDRDVVIAKPFDENCGRGVMKLEKKDFPSVKEMYDHIKQTNSLLVEEYIKQHSEISRLYPLSVNTLRVVTIVSDDGTPHILYAFIRIGNGGRVVDNINNGGMAAPIDLETGVINNVAFDKDSKYYDTHPYTGTKIVGHQIPMWDKVVETALSAARVVPQLRYVGWDVAVTETGTLLVEGNQHPGHDILQMPPHVPDKIGMLPRYKMFINI
ncbi:MAG: hypothetical protein IKS19_03150 [Clostridia bacterium]|nr:hypothetical protein [Clostridia bacterium]